MKKIVKLVIGIGLVLGIWWMVRCRCVDLKALTPASIRDYIRSFGDLAVLVYIAAYVLNTVSIVPPIAPLSLAAGLVFGAFRGAIYLMAGAMIGTSITFFISRFFGRSLVERSLKGKFKDLDERLEKNGLMTVLFFRVVPLVPYEVLNYFCGLSKIKVRDYFWATFFGLVPGVVIAAFFGGSLGEINSLKDVLNAKFLIAVGLMAMIIAIPALYQLLKKPEKKEGDMISTPEEIRQMEHMHEVMSYNQIDDLLFGGNNMCCQTHFEKELLSKGITADISLEAERLDNPSGVNYFFWFPWKEDTAPPMELINIAIDTLDALVKRGVKVYVHCRNGHGRTTTFLAAYFIHKGKTVEEALAYVLGKRPSGHLNDVQRSFLGQYGNKE